MKGSLLGIKETHLLLHTIQLKVLKLSWRMHLDASNVALLVGEITSAAFLVFFILK